MQWGCAETFPPNAHDEDACDNVWKKARKALKKKANKEKDKKFFLGKMENAEQIHVYKSPLAHPSEVQIYAICYKPEIYKSKGWCTLATDSQAWGICSPSCRYFVGLLVSIYNEHYHTFTVLGFMS